MGYRGNGKDDDGSKIDLGGWCFLFLFWFSVDIVCILSMYLVC